MLPVRPLAIRPDPGQVVQGLPAAFSLNANAADLVMSPACVSARLRAPGARGTQQSACWNVTCDWAVSTRFMAFRPARPIRLFKRQYASPPYRGDDAVNA